jgi:hypothetical protein
MSSVSSATHRYFWTICSLCKTSIRSDAADCKTCEGIASKELFLCPVGSDNLRRYHKKGLFGQNCIHCIFAGLHEARTVAQETAISQLSLCPGVCGLDQKIGQDSCRDCQAVANIDSIAAKQLAINYRNTADALHKKKWQSAVWSGAIKVSNASLTTETVIKASKRVATKPKSVMSLDLDEEEGKSGLKTWKQYQAEKASV